MPKRGTPPLDADLLQGTLDLLILQTLVLGPAHGHTIAYAIERRSDEVLQVEHGSLYPALHRLENRGWIASSWGNSENNRKARFYKLTPKGRNVLARCDAEVDRFEQAFFGALTAPEREVLRDLLVKVIAADRGAQATAELRLVPPAKRSGMRG